MNRPPPGLAEVLKQERNVAASIVGFLVLLLCLIGIVSMVLGMTSCVTTETSLTRTLPDGTREEIVTKTTSPDSDSLRAGTSAAGLILPYVIPEK
jgi:hypothetical protein